MTDEEETPVKGPVPVPPPVAAQEGEESEDPRETFKRVLDWTDDDILGSGEFQDIYYRPDGVPEEYPQDWLPGLRMRKVGAEDLIRYRRIYAGKPGEKGDPDRAEVFLLKKCFVGFLNLPDIVEKNGCTDELDYLLNTDKGKKFRAFAMTEFIVREVPSTSQGNGSPQRFKRY